MQQCGSYACYKVVEQEFLASPNPLKYASKDEKGIHVEKDVGKIAVHEHVCYQLEWLEERRLEVEQRKVFIHEVSGNHCNEVYDYIGYDQVLHYCKTPFHRYYISTM